MTLRGEQYLFPEFLLFKTLFEAHGIRTLIVDARELSVDSDSLSHHGRRIDLVYNRCTDFYFADARTRGTRGGVHARPGRDHAASVRARAVLEQGQSRPAE